MISIIGELSDIVSAEFLTMIYPLFQLYGHVDRTVERYFYQKSIIPKMVREFNSRPISKKMLCNFLFSLNFNHIKYIDFLIGEIISETSKEDYLEQRQEILFDYHKSYTQIVTYNNFAFDSRLPSVKEQILNWLNEEIKQCKRRLQKTPSNQNVLPFHKSTKFQTNLTVAQLSCLFKALNKVGIVSFENEKELFRAVAENFITPHTKQISVESLYNKQYDVEPRTKEIIKKALIDAAKSI